ncbi:MAG: hypothetical protein ACKVZ0_21860 [Gemmatimonadales bacterium]
MARSARLPWLVTLSIASTQAATGQTPRLHYPPPPPGQVSLTADIAVDSGLAIDVYRPRGATAAPALVIFAQGDGAHRRFHFFAGWGEIAAAHGVVGVVPGLRFGRSPQDFAAVLSHLRAHAREYGIDPEAIAVYAASGNVATALPLLQESTHRGVAAAVIYYGAAEVGEFRRDLPVLFVRAGLDRPPLNRDITALIAKATDQNAPISVINYSAGHHGFEGVDDVPTTREVIDQTMAFVKQWTSSAARADLRAGFTEATAAGYLLTGRESEASRLYGEMVARRPDDARLGLAYGEALLASGQFAAACTHFERLRGASLGPRDRGLPAAKACLQAGHPALAIGWLNSIPQRYRPASIKTDPAFASLQGHPDFEALFR